MHSGSRLQNTGRVGSDHRFRWLLASSATANLGDGIGKVAFPLLATTLTRDPVQIAALSAVQFLPWLLFAIPAGALIDRVDRKKAMIAANTARAVVVAAVTVLVAVHAMDIWTIYVAAVLVGTAETVADSTANVLPPALVPADGLESANSRLQACEIVGQTFLGGPVGSATFALFAAFPFLLTSAGFAVAAAVLLGLAGSYRPRAETAAISIQAGFTAGARWLREHPTLLRLLAVAGLLSLVSELAQAQLVLYALEDLRLSEAAFGLFSFVGGIGGLAGAALAPRLVRRTGRRPVLIGGVLCCALGFTGMGLVRQPVLAALLFGLFAAAVVAVNVVLATARHTLVPGELLGRVLGVWRTVVWGAIPVGALLGGLCTELLGSASHTFTASGVLLLAVAGYAAFALRRHALR
ncbi:putative MFS family arabinose efflux permease [Amycolatopsis sulphurea]|uniref:Putative MFS family arabinose efflux permease n=1 Tax=Amycolatopsis sulphurea TaxID=76022 RepID=A0A2A9FBH1_9PSEU|nr:MFS transporter [Amycolatopsis sulphurea]PFG48146.1 putative MFS family arabinose efflux permease [Amycolatopsis sulphurea]